MSLRCFSFSSDQGTTAILRQILSDLGVEGEFCTNAVPAVERITNQPFQLVIIDWDQQPEAGLLLNTARERKAAERPITLAIVSNDADAPKALHAGANSLLRKPIVASQAAETLATARDLLRSKQASSANPSTAVVASPSVPAFSVLPDRTGGTNLRAGEFLQTHTLAPGGLFETETNVLGQSEESAQTDPVKELEPMAASVGEEPASAPSAAKPGGSRGLQWYLNHRAKGQPYSSSAPASSAAAAAPAQVAPSTANPARGNPELLGYEQTSAYSPSRAASARPSVGEPRQEPPAKPEPTVRQQKHEQKREAELFAYMQGEKQHRSEQPVSSGVLFGKRAIVPAILLASIAVMAAPQAPWHARLQGLWHGGQQRLHTWLNPQPVIPTPRPAAHESFTRPGDEYKLPVAEPIPDATTDPTQIEVVPVIDPTIKKTNPEGGNTIDSSAVPAQPSSTGADTPAQTTTTPLPENQPAPASSDPFRPVVERTVPSNHQISVIEPPVAAHPESTPVFPVVVVTPRNTQPQPQSHPVSPAGSIPQSLKSQLAPATAVTVNKPVDAGPAAIEPVPVPEAVERGLILDSPSPAYPSSARGQQGTVVLQVLIARDGTVQEAKFMQGSLIFARNAADSVKQWRFKPYILNGRPVSVQSQLTLKFKPGQ